MTLRIMAVAALLALAGCATSDAVNDPVFREGYDMGCGMAHAAREARAALTAGKPELYRRGFASGFSACGGEHEMGY